MAKKPFPFKVCEECCDGGGSSVAIDKTLSIEGAAADAKTVGDELINLKPYIFELVVDEDFVVFEGQGVSHDVLYNKLIKGVPVIAKLKLLDGSELLVYSEGEVVTDEARISFSLTYKGKNYRLQIDEADVWTTEVFDSIPNITDTDEGKVLKVVNGKATWVTDYVNAEEVAY